MQHFSDDGEAPGIPIQPIAKERLSAWLEDQTDAVAAWVGAVEFKAKGGEICLVPGPGGNLEMVLVGLSEEREGPEPVPVPLLEGWPRFRATCSRPARDPRERSTRRPARGTRR